MASNRFALLVLIAGLVAGCGKTAPEDACAELRQVTDPARRAELLKQCPRAAGPEFKPSKKREW